MTSVRAFHPPLFALAIPLNLFAANVAIVSSTEIWMPTLATVLAAACIWGLTYLALRDWVRAASVASIGTLAVFTYSDVASWMESIYSDGSLYEAAVRTWIWVLAFVVLVLIAGWKAPYSKGLAVFLNVAGAAMALLSIFGTVQAIGAQSRFKVQRNPESATGQTAKVRKPDFFYIVLDGYGREDVLRSLYALENRPFLDALDKRGFTVADRARSNFCQTELSLASSLNLCGIEGLPRPSGEVGFDRLALDRMIDDNRTARTLRELGYAYVAVTSGFAPLRFESADYVAETPAKYSLFTDALLAKTPIRFGRAAIQSRFRTRRTEILGALDTLQRIARPSAAPRFVVAHVFAPHPPFVFGPNGEEVESEMPFGHWDGSHYIDQGGSKTGYRQGYAGQLAYLNRHLLRTVDAIVEQNPQAVVVLQGDHGPKSELDQNSREKTNLRESFSIFLAAKTGGVVRTQLPPEATPLTTMRSIVGELASVALPPADDGSYYSRWDAPLDFEKIDDRLEK